MTLTELKEKFDKDSRYYADVSSERLRWSEYEAAATANAKSQTYYSCALQLAEVIEAMDGEIDRLREALEHVKWFTGGGDEGSRDEMLYNTCCKALK